MMEKEISKEYSNGEITIVWQPKKWVLLLLNKYVPLALVLVFPVIGFQPIEI